MFSDVKLIGEGTMEETELTPYDENMENLIFCMAPNQYYHEHIYPSDH